MKKSSEGANPLKQVHKVATTINSNIHYNYNYNSNIDYKYNYNSNIHYNYCINNVGQSPIYNYCTVTFRFCLFLKKYYRLSANFF